LHWAITARDMQKTAMTPSWPMLIRSGQPSEAGCLIAVHSVFRLHSAFNFNKSAHYCLRSVCELIALKGAISYNVLMLDGARVI